MKNRNFFHIVTFISIVLLATQGAADSQTRSSSRFRIRAPNPHDQTQPAPSASTTIQRRTSLANPVRRRQDDVKDIIVPQQNALSRRQDHTPLKLRDRVNGRPRIRARPTTQSKASLPPTHKVEVNAVESAPSTGDYKIVCYFTNWSQYRPKIGKFLPENVDPHLCTHIIYAFAWMKKGKLSSYEGNDESKDGKVGFYEQINGLRKVNPKLKILLALGGWSFGTKRFREMAATRYTRQTFIFSAIPFLREHEFDGFDLDWEYPKGKDDKENFVFLLKEIKEAFEAESLESGKPTLLLSAAVPVGPDNVRGGYDVPAISKYLDFINLMAYDFHGKWENQVGHNAPLYAPSSDSEWRKQLSVDHASNMWVRLGAPREKLIIGIPTYGRSFTLSNPERTQVNSPASSGGQAGKYTGEDGFLAYYEICEHLRNGAEYIWHEEMQVPYMVHGNLWVGFDDERATRNKMKYIIKNGFGGAMVWSIDMDDFSGTACGTGVKYPLIGIIREELNGIPRVGKDVDWAAVTRTSVAQRATLPPPTVVNPKQILQRLTPTTNVNRIQFIPSVPRDQPKVLCYYTSWAVKRPGAGRFEPENIDPFLCTHIIYSFGGMEDYKIAPSQQTDLADGLNPGTYARLVALKEKNSNLKILLAIGGWTFGAKPFRELVSNQFRMNGFVYDSVDFLRKHNFDGLDIDWEYPQGVDDKANFVNLLRELRIAYEGEAKATGQPRLLLSAAVPASFEALQAGYDVPEISKYLDFINIMTYDFHGQWEDVVGHNSPLMSLDGASSRQRKLTVDYSVREWIKEGAPPQKIMLGIPTYGRSFTLLDSREFDIGAPVSGGGFEGRYTKESGFLSYYEICEFLFEDNTTLIWDNEQLVPFAHNGKQWVGFDDERSMTEKTNWMKSVGLGGAMVWSIDMDDFRGNCGGNKFPLINTIKENLGNYSVQLTYNGPYENTGTLEGRKTLKDPNELVCDELEGHISYHSDKIDCTKYYMCEGDRKHHMPCPHNLVFNPTQTVCDWPENVEGCENAITSTAKRR